MAFLDNLKKQVSQASSSAQNAFGVAGGDRCYRYIFSQIPANLAQMKAMPEAALTKPEHTAALTVAALCIYPMDKTAALEMLEYLHGPKGLSQFDRQFIADRFRDKDYVPRSYFKGAVPENNYEPAEPYTIEFFENPYSRNNIGEGYLTLHVHSGGADSARQIKLRTKASTGQWFLWEQFLLADIRKPVSADPWA